MASKSFKTIPRGDAFEAARVYDIYFSVSTEKCVHDRRGAGQTYSLNIKRVKSSFFRAFMSPRRTHGLRHTFQLGSYGLRLSNRCCARSAKLTGARLDLGLKKKEAPKMKNPCYNDRYEMPKMF